MKFPHLQDDFTARATEQCWSYKIWQNFTYFEFRSLKVKRGAGVDVLIMPLITFTGLDLNSFNCYGACKTVQIICLEFL